MLDRNELKDVPLGQWVRFCAEKGPGGKKKAKSFSEDGAPTYNTPTVYQHRGLGTMRKI